MQTNPTSSSHGIGSSGKRAETRLQNRSVVLLYKSGLDPAREVYGGGKETRTPDPHAASVMLYQLSYAPATRPYSRRQTRLLRLPRGRARYTVGLVSTRTKWPRAGDVAQLVEHLLCM